MQLDTIGSDFDTLLAVYTGYDIANLQHVASDDQSGGNDTSSLTFEAFAGYTYQFAVDGYHGAAGTAKLNLSVANDNDAFANAAFLSGYSFSVTDANAGAGADTGEPMHDDEPGGASLWWRWTPQVSGTVVIDTIGSDFDTLLAVYHGTEVDALSPIDSDDESGGSGTSLVSFHANDGIEYYIAVDGWQGATGNIRLNARMDHDAFENRLHLDSQRIWLIDSNAGATKENSEPAHAGETGGASVWWSWTPPVSGTARIYTTGSDFDTLLAVYSGTEFAAMTELASNDEGGPHHISYLTLAVEAGVAYQVAVDGYNAETGTIGLSADVSNDNDAFADRAALSGTDIQIHDDNFSATRETDEPEHADNPGGGSIWWSWTAPHTAAVEISAFGSSFDTLLAVYTGAELNALAVAAADQDIDGFGGSEVTFLAKAGTTYQIAVDGVDDARGYVELLLSLAPANDAFENAAPPFRLLRDRQRRLPQGHATIARTRSRRQPGRRVALVDLNRAGRGRGGDRHPRQRLRHPAGGLSGKLAHRLVSRGPERRRRRPHPDQRRPLQHSRGRTLSHCGGRIRRRPGRHRTDLAGGQRRLCQNRAILRLPRPIDR